MVCNKRLFGWINENIFLEDCKFVLRQGLQERTSQNQIPGFISVEKVPNEFILLTVKVCSGDTD
jgi:hypothetical protein